MMVDASPVDAIFFQPSDDDIREDPFVLPDAPHHIPQAMTDALTGRLINDPSGLGMHIGAQSI